LHPITNNKQFYMERKKDLKTIAKGRLSRLLLLLVFFLANAGTALAIDQIELNTDYTMSGLFVKHYYSVVAPSDGQMVVWCSDASSTPRPYTDSTFGTQVSGSFSYLSTGGQYVFTVTAGTTYYLYCKTQNSDACTFNVKMANTLSMTGVSPEEGSVYDVNKGTLSITFNLPVDMQEATLTAGTYSKALTRANSNANSSLYFDGIGAIVGEIISSGAAKAGDEFTVTVSGVHATSDASLVYGTDGTVKVKYVLPEMPTYVTSKTVPEKFLSYWDKGNEDGLLKLTFSKDLSTTSGTYAYLAYGNIDNDADGEYYNESPLPLTISGNTLTIDFTDKIRTPQTMTPQSDSIYGYVSIKICDVKDVDGNSTYTGSSANVGSYTFSIPYEMLTQSDVMTEFTPASGSSLADVDNIELYISGESALRYDGVIFTYDNDGASDTITVANSEINKIEEGDDIVTLNIPVPDAAKTGKNVKVSLANLACIDGVDRANTISATYNEAFALYLVEPTTLELDSLPDSIVVRTSMTSKIGVMRMEIYDLNPVDPLNACIQSSAYMSKEYVESAQDTCFVYRWESQYKQALLAGHSYRISFTAAANEEDYRKKNFVGTDTIMATGLTKAYVYSTYKLVGVDPHPSDCDIVTTDAFTVNVEFDGLVTINSSMAFISNGSGGTSSLASIVPADEGATADTKYSKKWALTVGSDVVESLGSESMGSNTLSIVVAAEDENGSRVNSSDILEGDLITAEGTEDQSYFTLNYDAYLGPDFEMSPADSSTVTELYKFVASYSPAIATSGNVALKKAILYNEDGVEVAHIANEDYPWDDTTIWNLYLDKTITEPGTYKLYIPGGYFNLGEDMNAQVSKPTTFTYIIAGVSKTLAPVAIEPDTLESKTISELSTVTLTFGENVVINPNGEITVVNKADRTTVTTATAAVSATDSTVVVITLATPITTEGSYTVVVPEGMIGNAEYETSGYASGNCNAEYGFNYVVGEEVVDEEVVEADPAPGEVSSLSRIILTFPNDADVAPTYDTSVGEIELRDATGAKVVGATSDIDWNIEEYNKIPVDLASEVTEAGTYTLHIPAGFYTLSGGSRMSKEINLTYTIEGGTTAINGVVVSGNNVDIYSLSGVKVKSGVKATEATKELQRGVYIVNGKKFVVK